ncbi:MAG TPA: TonB-dependent receptor, partial [Chitinophagaceae bacterium]|nr:TonB-dependent receptor [Chitinophagaceae bacterium]
MKNLKRCLLCVLLFVSFTAAKAQQSVITGKITDGSGDPIAGASITASTGGGTTSDARGMFRLSIARGQVTLTISNVGYKTVTKEITAEDESQVINVVLEEDRVGLNTVVVTATSSPRRTQQVMPLSITTYNETKLEKVKYNSNADILRGIPGITAENGGGEVASNIFVRGLPSGGQYQFTPLQIDGMPVISTMGLTSSAPDVYFRNDLGISRLEFVRGGSATL